MRISLQPAFILHYRPYRESSFILDLFTQEYGRIALVARGIRTARSKTRSLFQPFVPLLTTWQGKSELMTLCSIEANGMPIYLRGKSLLSAFYLNELLVRVLHKHDPHPKIYSLYHETLRLLQISTSDQHEFLKTLRLFEKKLLQELGYGLQLQYDIPAGNCFMAEKYYLFCPEQGFKEIFLDMNTNIKKKEGIFLGKSLQALATEELNTIESLQDAKRLMRLALAPLLGSQPLQSRKLFVEVENNASS